MPGKPWTQRDINTLRWGWGDVTLQRLAQRLGRTPRAVCHMAVDLGLGPQHRGRLTLNAVARLIGYEPTAVKAEARRLQLKPKYVHGYRTHGTPSAILYSEDDVQRLQEAFESRTTVRYVP